MAAMATEDHSAHAHAAVLENEAIAPTDDDRVPVTILTGFLGSGKTTLLNYILTAKHGSRIAVIENEFGAVGIDDSLLKRNMKEHTEDEIIETINGCICCEVRGDLIKTFEKLAERMHGGGGLKIEAVIVETTGMADPSPVAQTFFADEIVQENFRLDGIVTLVDAKHVLQHLDEERADGAINESVQQIAFADRIILNKVDLVPDEATLLATEQRIRSINSFSPLARATNSQVPIDGILGIRAFDLKKTLMENPAFLTSGVVSHDKSVTSYAINVPNDVDLTAIQDMLNALISEVGANIYRMKGILAVADVDERFVYHGVHMLFSGRFMETWEPGEERCCKLVFIGKDLNHEAIRAAFDDCLATPEALARRATKLRFRVGDAVECRFDAGWLPGKVVELFARDRTMPMGERAPYVVQLNNGDLITAPADMPQVIRSPDGDFDPDGDDDDDDEMEDS